MTIRRNFFRPNLRAVLLHQKFFLRGGVFAEETFCAVEKSFRGKGGVARRLRLIKRVTAKFCALMIFFQLDDFKVHAPQNFSDCFLLRAIFFRPPAVLNRNCLAVMIRVRKFFVGQNQFPNRFAKNFGMPFLENRRAVVANGNHRRPRRKFFKVFNRAPLLATQPATKNFFSMINPPKNPQGEFTLLIMKNLL